MPLNDANFLIWYPPSESPTKPPVARPFVQEPDVLSPVVWLLPGETYKYYLNDTGNATYADTLNLVSQSATPIAMSAQTSASITFPVEGGTGSHRYGSFTVPQAPEGFYYIRMGIYCSQWLYLTTPDKAARFTAMVEFRSSERYQNFRYPHLPNNFYQKFRVRLAVKSETSQHNKEVYTEAVTGKRRHYYSEPGWVVSFQTAEYDRWGHRAIAAMIEHDEVLINGQRYSYESGYNSNMTEGDALSTGEFSMREEAYSSLHES